MPLGMGVDLSPGDFVFDGDPAPSQKMRKCERVSIEVHRLCHSVLHTRILMHCDDVQYQNRVLEIENRPEVEKSKPTSPNCIITIIIINTESER